VNTKFKQSIKVWYNIVGVKDSQQFDIKIYIELFNYMGMVKFHTDIR